MKHIHHIIPRHIGGTDDPDNLVELSVEEHAEAHLVLYEQYGREEDRMAWLGLSGQASKKEVCLIGYKLGRVKTDEILEQKYGSEWRSILSKMGTDKATAVIKDKIANDPLFAENMRKNAKKASEAAMSSESIEKRKQSFAKNNHQQGSKNSQWSKMWVYNDELKITKTIDRGNSIPEGWVKGRKFKF